MSETWPWFLVTLSLVFVPPVTLWALDKVKELFRD